MPQYPAGTGVLFAGCGDAQNPANVLHGTSQTPLTHVPAYPPVVHDPDHGVCVHP